MRRYLQLALATCALGVPMALVWASVPGDIETYYLYAHKIAGGAAPYRDVFIEYPPLAVLLFVLPHVFVSAPAAYATVFMGLMAAADLGQKLLLLKTFPERRGWLLALTSGGTAAMYYTAFNRFDVIVAALTVLACVQLCATPRGFTPWVCLGLAASIKVVPALVAPLALLHCYRRHVPWRRLAQQCGVFILICTAPGVIAYAWVGNASFKWFLFHQARGLHIASTYASGLMAAQGLGHPVAAAYGFGCLQVLAPDAATLAQAAPFVTLILLGVTLWRFLPVVGEDSAVWRGVAALFLAMILGNKVLSPQYMLWLLPVIAVAVIQPRRPSRIMALLLLDACLLTMALHPGEEELARGDGLAQLVLIGRNMTLVILWFLLIRRPACTPQKA